MKCSREDVRRGYGGERARKRKNGETESKVNKRKVIRKRGRKGKEKENNVKW